MYSMCSRINYSAMGKKSGPRKAHQFGGIWTEQKLAALKKYLVAYQTIFKQNLAASITGPSTLMRSRERGHALSLVGCND